MSLKRNSTGALVRHGFTGALCSTCCLSNYWLIESIQVPVSKVSRNALVGGFYWEVLGGGFDDAGNYYITVRKWNATNDATVWASGGFHKLGSGAGVYVNAWYPSEDGAPQSVELVMGA